MAVYEKKEEEGQKRTDAAAIGRRYHCDFLNEWITALNEWAPFLSECHWRARPARKNVATTFPVIRFIGFARGTRALPGVHTTICCRPAGLDRNFPCCRCLSRRALLKNL